MVKCIILKDFLTAYTADLLILISSNLKGYMRSTLKQPHTISAFKFIYKMSTNSVQISRQQTVSVIISVTVVYEKNTYSFIESYETHRYMLWSKCSVI
jgi:hypothetical protein